MKKVQLDFVPQRGPAGALLLLLALLFALWLGWQYQQSLAQLARQEQLLARLAAKEKSRPQPVPLSQAGREQLQAGMKAANQVIDKLALPWEALFQAIESASDEQTGLLGIEPDSEKKILRISAEAKDLPAMLAYQKRLASLGLMRHVHVVSHQVQVQDPARAVRFELQASWQERDMANARGGN